MNEFNIQIDKILKNRSLPTHNVAEDKDLPEGLPSAQGAVDRGANLGPPSEY
jgi:hypothetical protein